MTFVIAEKGQYIALSAIASIEPNARGVYNARTEDGRLLGCVDIDNFERARTSMIPCSDGWECLFVFEDDICVESVIAWALCANGCVEPVTPMTMGTGEEMRYGLRRVGCQEVYVSWDRIYPNAEAYAAEARKSL